MSNNRYSDRDQGNSSKERPAGEGKMKNVDGRLKGKEWDKQTHDVKFADKSVGVEPNAGAPHLKEPTVDGTVI